MLATCPAGCSLATSFSPGLVALSVLIASLASYVALDLGGRTVVSSGRSRSIWLAGGSLAMGAGIWSMHFVGMLAFRLHTPGHAAGHAPLPLAYDVPLVVLSVVAAVVASAIALGVVSRPQLGLRAHVLAGVLLGAAIAGMHYIGMAAMRMDARLGWDPSLVAASLLIAVGASFAALWLLQRLGNASSAAERSAKRGAAGVMGLAITGMHYTAMAAARFAPTDAGPAAGWLPPHSASRVVATGGLAAGVALAALVVLGVAILGVSLDRLHRMRLDDQLRRSEERYRTLVENSPECIVLHAGGRIVYANASAVTLFGFDAARSPVGRELAEFVHPDSRRQLADRLLTAVTPEDRSEALEFRVVRADGIVLDVEAVSVPVVHDGTPAVQTHLRDITRRKELERELSHQAFHDAVTGLANRVLFRDRVEHALARAARGGARPVVLFLDLDNFKAVNDGFGHATGDRLLVDVAARLKGLLRAADTCARLGGDEFAVLLEEPPASGTGETHAAYVAERLIHELGRPFRCEGAEFLVGVSVGIAAAEPGDGVEELLRNADLAMYRAKARGKGRYEVFEPAMHETVRRRLELEAELRAAVEAGCGEFVLHYQPIARITDSAVTGFEALVRWRHPRRGVVPPGEFIAIAEETGLIVPLGRMVLREACRQTQRWQRVHDAPLTITVNVSGRQLADPDFVREVSAALAATGLTPAALVLEMTESVLIDDSEGTLGRLAALKALGVRIAIDDFGTGYSSLAYLRRFPVDLLKIDKTFIDEVGSGTAESPLPRAILGLGGALGMAVVAEGVETASQWERLREMGCELGQGYFLARPMPPADAERLLLQDEAVAAA
jgi:diguanylate cyclase